MSDIGMFCPQVVSPLGVHSDVQARSPWSPTDGAWLDALPLTRRTNAAVAVFPRELWPPASSSAPSALLERRRRAAVRDADLLGKDVPPLLEVELIDTTRPTTAEQEETTPTNLGISSSTLLGRRTKRSSSLLGVEAAPSQTRPRFDDVVAGTPTTPTTVDPAGGRTTGPGWTVDFRGGWGNFLTRKEPIIHRASASVPVLSPISTTRRGAGAAAGLESPVAEPSNGMWRSAGEVHSVGGFWPSSSISGPAEVDEQESSSTSAGGPEVEVPKCHPFSPLLSAHQDCDQPLCGEQTLNDRGPTWNDVRETTLVSPFQMKKLHPTKTEDACGSADGGIRNGCRPGGCCVCSKARRVRL